jgi:uncharacterized membrane protein (UPF0127 family)
MKVQKIGISYKGKKITLRLKVCRGLNEAIGLMFKRRENASALLFTFKNKVKMAIHSWFVFFPFVAIWLNKENKIIDIKIVKPFEFSISPSEKYFKLIEIPINKRYSKIINILVDTRKI